jgi:hypothetical protein
MQTRTAPLLASKPIIARHNFRSLSGLSHYQPFSPSELIMSQDVASETHEAKQEPENMFEPFGRGIVRDYKMRLPMSKSDFTDGINVQVREGS